MNPPADIIAPEPGAVPPKLSATRPGKPLALVLSVAAAVGGCALLFLFNPAEYAFYPRCMFHQLTGLHCPGCGGLRAAHQLLHGQALAALQSNGLAVLSLPVAGALMWREFAGRRRGIKGRPFISRRLGWCLVGMLLGFTVLRNLPVFAFLSP